MIVKPVDRVGSIRQSLPEYLFTKLLVGTLLDCPRSFVKLFPAPMVPRVGRVVSCLMSGFSDDPDRECRAPMVKLVDHYI